MKQLFIAVYCKTIFGILAFLLSFFVFAQDDNEPNKAPETQTAPAKIPQAPTQADSADAPETQNQAVPANEKEKEEAQTPAAAVEQADSEPTSDLKKDALEQKPAEAITEQSLDLPSFDAILKSRVDRLDSKLELLRTRVDKLSGQILDFKSRVASDVKSDSRVVFYAKSQRTKLELRSIKLYLDGILISERKFEGKTGASPADVSQPIWDGFVVNGCHSLKAEVVYRSSQGFWHWLFPHDYTLQGEQAFSIKQGQMVVFDAFDLDFSNSALKFKTALFNNDVKGTAQISLAAVLEQAQLQVYMAPTLDQHFQLVEQQVFLDKIPLRNYSTIKDPVLGGMIFDSLIEKGSHVLDLTLIFKPSGKLFGYLGQTRYKLSFSRSFTAQAGVKTEIYLNNAKIEGPNAPLTGKPRLSIELATRPLEAVEANSIYLIDRCKP